MRSTKGSLTFNSTFPYIARSGRGVTTFPMSHITGLGTRLTEGVRSESSGREGAGSAGRAMGTLRGKQGKSKWQIYSLANQ